MQRRMLALLAGEIDHADIRRGLFRRLAVHAAATVLTGTLTGALTGALTGLRRRAPR
jgi:hypothetical protein